MSAKLGGRSAAVSLLVAASLLLAPSTAGWATPQRRSVLSPPAQPKVVPFVATPVHVLAEMLRVVQLRSGDVLYDLGSGDGRIVITAAKLARVRAVGVEIDPERISESLRNAELAGVSDRVQFIQGDFFGADLRRATVVTMYLLTDVNLRLRPKLLAELRPCARVVSHSFGMGDWKPDRTSNRAGTPVHLWVIPANVSGQWSFRLPDGSTDRYRLRLRQRYQEVTASLSVGGRAVRVRQARLRGDRLTLTVLLPRSDGPMAVRFAARLRGNTLTGEMRSARAELRLGTETGVGWRAYRDPSTVAAIDGTGAL